VLSYGVMRREELDYLKLTVLVSAILTSGRIAAGADAGDSLRTAMQSYRGALFPEIKSDLLAKAKQNEKILEQEFTKGPLKIKPLDYGTKRKKNR
jgi:hypothetical protein